MSESRNRKSIFETSCKHNILEFIYYIQKIREPNLIAIDDQSLEKLETILAQMDFLIKNSKDLNNVLESFCKDSLVQLFVRLLEYCFDFINSVFEVLYNAKLTKKEKQRVLNKGRTVYTFLLTFVQLIWCLTNFSIKFRRLFHTQQGSLAIFHYIANKRFLEFVLYKTNIFEESPEPNEQFMLIDAFIGSLHNLSKSVKFENNINATKLLISFAHEIRAEKGHLMQIYMILANIMTDKEIDELKDTIVIVNKLVEIIGQCAKLIKEQRAKLKRSKIEFDNGRVEYVCNVSDDNGVKWDLTELIRALYRIAVNDRIKYYIYNDCNTKEYIDQIVLYGNMIEKEYAIRLLYQLSFDKRIADLIREDSKLVDSINNLNESTSNANDVHVYTKLLEYCKGIIWNIETKNNVNRTQTPVSPAVAEKSKDTEDPGEKQHQIMISYNSANRDMCMSIKKELEALGFKIWIDVENIHGSSLEAMALAIENSDCILICMTEKYKLSPNCRAEAEYTFNIRKAFIPLIMQPNYRPDGWLGILLGARIFIDFTKYAFEVSMEKLRKEIMQGDGFKKFQLELKSNWKKVENLNSITKFMSQKSSEKQTARSEVIAITNGSSSTSKPAVVIEPKSSDVAKESSKTWSKEKVQEWLTDQEIDPSIIDKFKEFNGEMLCELNTIRTTASEYFYTEVSQQNKIDLNKVVKFSNAIRKLTF